MTTHGTPATYSTGCTVDAWCPNHRTNLMTCREAAIRYRGDYQYARLVDAGTPPLTRETFVEPKPERAPKRRPTRLRREPKPATVSNAPKRRRILTNGIIGPDGLTHGTSTGYRRCKDPVNCPAVAAGKRSCVEVGRELAAKKWRERHNPTARTRVAKHGTPSGYSQFKCRDNCPAAANGGVSCRQSATDAARARYARKREKVAA